MAEWRRTGTSCPLDESAIDLHGCGECRFFRGASASVSEEPAERGRWKMLCNWPRDGAYDALASAPLPKFLLNLDLPQL